MAGGGTWRWEWEWAWACLSSSTLSCPCPVAGWPGHSAFRWCKPCTSVYSPIHAYYKLIVSRLHLYVIICFCQYTFVKTFKINTIVANFSTLILSYFRYSTLLSIKKLLQHFSLIFCHLHIVIFIYWFYLSKDENI